MLSSLKRINITEATKLQIGHMFTEPGWKTNSITHGACSPECGLSTMRDGGKMSIQEVDTLGGNPLVYLVRGESIFYFVSTIIVACYILNLAVSQPHLYNAKKEWNLCPVVVAWAVACCSAVLYATLPTAGSDPVSLKHISFRSSHKILTRRRVEGRGSQHDKTLLRVPLCLSVSLTVSCSHKTNKHYF